MTAKQEKTQLTRLELAISESEKQKELYRSAHEIREKHEIKNSLLFVSFVYFVGEFLSFCFFNFLDHHRNGFEEVADDAVVGDVEDRSFGVFVDGDDRAGVLHADDVLDRTRDAESDVNLRSDRLARRAYLAVDRQPVGVADRPRGRKIGSQSIRKLLCKSDILLRFDAASDGDDDLAIL